MNEIVAFIMGIAFKSLVTVALGGVFTRFANVVVDDIKDWPRIYHYLQAHPGRWLNCDPCQDHSPKVSDLS